MARCLAPLVDEKDEKGKNCKRRSIKQGSLSKDQMQRDGANHEASQINGAKQGSAAAAATTVTIIARATKNDNDHNDNKNNDDNN